MQNMETQDGLREQLRSIHVGEMTALWAYDDQPAGSPSLLQNIAWVDFVGGDNGRVI